MNIIRYYNQNKKVFWIITTIIIAIIVVIHTINYMIKIDKENNKANNEITIINEKDYKENPDISVEVKDEEVKEDKALIIDQFIRYCNAGKVQEAYNLLSTSCKNNVYPTLEKFTNKYYKTVYNSTKLYSKEPYASGTYKIKLYEDSLTTGKVSGSHIEDYFTIITENDETKLNISQFIKEEDLNIVGEGKFLNITIKKKIVYKECTEFILEIKNLTDKDIMLDSLRNTKSAYVISNNLAYYAALNENTENDMTIYSNLTKTIRVKFNIEYNAKNNITSMNFSNIILDKKQYDLAEKKKDYDKVTNMCISFK